MHFGIFLAALAVVAGVLHRLRLGRLSRGETPLVTDDVLRQIEATGYVELDEPLDMEQIREEEARFLEEYRWDDTDEL